LVVKQSVHLFAWTKSWVHQEIPQAAFQGLSFRLAGRISQMRALSGFTPVVRPAQVGPIQRSKGAWPSL
jgi:hypothetical protein